MARPAWLRFFRVFIFMVTDGAIDLHFLRMCAMGEFYRAHFCPFELEYHCIGHVFRCRGNIRREDKNGNNEEHTDCNTSFLLHITPPNIFHVSKETKSEVFPSQALTCPSFSSGLLCTKFPSWIGMATFMKSVKASNPTAHTPKDTNSSRWLGTYS